MAPPRHLLSPTTRFSNRADAYHASRPSIPGPIIDAALNGVARGPRAIIDIGAGTGISALALAAAVSGASSIIALEPNADMRAYGRRASGPHARISWLDTTAEATGLPDACVDLALSVNAFHWFSPELAPNEIARILRPGGRLVVAATDRDPDDARANELHRLMGETEAGVSAANIHQWYGHAFVAGRYSTPRLVVADNPQEFDLARLIARAHSSSYWPADKGAQGHAREALTGYHRRHADADGVLRVMYRTIALMAERITAAGA